MLVSRYVLQVAPEFEITRTETGVDLTFFYGLSGSYDPDTELYYWFGDLYAVLGEDEAYVSQEFDRPMDLSFSASLQDGVTEYGRYELSDQGDRGAYLSLEFALTSFSSAADYDGGGRIAQFVFGSNEADRILGGGAGDVLEGANGADLLAGRAGADQINGGGKDDVLNGGAGRDTLRGGTGDDHINGGDDADVLVGGQGADEFLFRTAPTGLNADLIRDFVSGEDQILLDDAVFTGLGARGPLPESAFRLGAGPATDLGQRILYDQSLGLIFYDEDGSGGAEAVLLATLKPGTVLEADDFRIV